MDIDTSDPKQQRNFGLLMAGAFIVLGLIRWGIHRGDPPFVFLYIAAPFLILGLAAPIVLKPILIAWMKLAEVLNWIVTRVVLTIAYILVLTPMGFIMRAMGKDPLNRKYLPEANTYWEDPPDQPEGIEHYRRQF